jgi:hypothetical protein
MEPEQLSLFPLSLIFEHRTLDLLAALSAAPLEVAVHLAVPVRVIVKRIATDPGVVLGTIPDPRNKQVEARARQP